MNALRTLPLIVLVGCSAAAVEGNMPETQQQPAACTPHRVPWLKQGAHWRFESTGVNGAKNNFGAFSVDLGPGKQTNGYTLYELVTDAKTDLWTYIGTNTCGDIVVSDGTTIYTVYTEATQAWSGVGFFAEYDTSANVYTDAPLIPSLASSTSTYGSNSLTAMGTVDGEASDCVFYAYYGTACGTGSWANVKMDLEYWDLKTGPIGRHTASPGHELRIERSDAVIAQREPDGYDTPASWAWDTELTGEIGPLDKAAAPKSSLSAQAAAAQDWIAVVLDAQHTVLFDWSGDADLELFVLNVTTGANVRTVPGEKNAARVTLEKGAYRIGVHRKDTRVTEAIYTFNAITDMTN